MTIDVAVFGAGGRVGREVCRAVLLDPELTLTAAIDPGAAGQTVGAIVGIACEIEVVDSPSELPSGVADVGVDFTNLEPARGNLAWMAEQGVHAVVGTTGFTDDDLAGFASAFTSSNCLVAPNFAIGAVLMMHFAEVAAPWFETAEIIEMHHENKIDAPSGTAMMTARRMAGASADWRDDPTENHVVPGARGGSGPGGITMHSVRMRGAVAHQEVILGAMGQTLTIRHDSMDRTSFMPGVLLAAKQIADHPGITLGLDDFLGL